MKQVAKLVLIDENGSHLLMHRSNHPTFGLDPDLPGGTLDDGEQPIETMIREVFEEAGITIDSSQVTQLYQGTDYSAHGTEYSLYAATVGARPVVTMSWEHSSFEWIDRAEFLAKAGAATDTYMHMVHAVLSRV